MSKKTTALGACLKSLYNLCYLQYECTYTETSIQQALKDKVDEASALRKVHASEAWVEFAGYAGTARGDRAAHFVVLPWAEAAGIDLELVDDQPLPEGLIPRWGSDDDMDNKIQEQTKHALTKLLGISILAALRKKVGDRVSDKEMFQFGYNAGRLAELTGMGRLVWDTLKGAVEVGDWDAVSTQIVKWEEALGECDSEETDLSNLAAAR